MDNQIDPNESLSVMIENEKLYLANSRFESCGELVKNVRSFYCKKGYGLSVRNSKKDKFVILQCDRGGSYRDIWGIEDKRKKNTGSRLTNCPFRIEGRKGSDGAWVFKTKDLTHNHDPSTDISGHPSFRRLPPNSVQHVKEMTKSGIPPRQILSSLRQQNPNLRAISRTIYNLKAKIRKDDLGNRSMVSALFEELTKGGFLYDVLHDEQGHITSLFISHPLSVKLTKVFSNIFLMDCTYKTNKYHMPLLDIIGVSCFNTTFYSGFAFLEREDKESYIWALKTFQQILGQGNQPRVIVSDRELALMNSISDVFPTATNLLCIWHIEKNVLANCKKHFTCGEDFDMFMLCWNNVVYSTTETIYMKNWSDFEFFYKDKKDAVEYIKNIWLPWKEKFMSPWTEKYLHFGTRSSSRVEGAHAKLKQYLQVSTGGFQEVKDKICLAVEHEFNEIKVKLASTMMPCTGHFTTTMGIPCAHKIQSWNGITLSLDLIHPQWRIGILSLSSEDGSNSDDTNGFAKLLDELYSKYEEWPLNKKKFATSMITKLVNQSDTFFEPVIHRPKGRPPKPKKKRGITSTTRDPLRFEIVESSRTLNPTCSPTENNIIDLNEYPEFSSDFMSFG